MASSVFGVLSLPLLGGQVAPGRGLQRLPPSPARFLLHLQLLGGLGRFFFGAARRAACVGVYPDVLVLLLVVAGDVGVVLAVVLVVRALAG